MNSIAANPSIAENHLTNAFSTFIAAADRLERAHCQLHDEVAELRMQLEERNRALACSVAQNERMRIALQQILDALPCGVVVLEPEQERIVRLNPQARILLDLTSHQSPVWTDLPQAVRAMLHPEHCETWKQGDEHDFFFNEGHARRCVTVRYSAVEADSSRNQVILTCRDTSIFRDAEQKRESSRNLVALAEMATVLAHEVPEPPGKPGTPDRPAGGRRGPERGFQAIHPAFTGWGPVVVCGRQQCAALSQ